MIMMTIIEPKPNGRRKYTKENTTYIKPRECLVITIYIYIYIILMQMEMFSALQFHHPCHQQLMICYVHFEVNIVNYTISQLHRSALNQKSLKHERSVN